MGKSERITITIGKELLDFLDSLVDERIFANRSHALEVLVKHKMEIENEAKDYGYLR
jgi:metal-responsive CopG/Arc/MetJ family transcriptional regulator